MNRQQLFDYIRSYTVVKVTLYATNPATGDDVAVSTSSIQIGG